jgi:hypothetical protein
MQKLNEIKFENLIISGPVPHKKILKTNIKRSTEILRRLAKCLETPGVDFPDKKNVPLFSVSEGEKNVFIRRLNGRTERGRLVDGNFKVIE